MLAKDFAGRASLLDIWLTFFSLLDRVRGSREHLSSSPSSSVHSDTCQCPPAPFGRTRHTSCPMCPAAHPKIPPHWLMFYLAPLMQGHCLSRKVGQVLTNANVTAVPRSLTPPPGNSCVPSLSSASSPLTPAAPALCSPSSITASGVSRDGAAPSGPSGLLCSGPEAVGTQPAPSL